MASPRRIVRIYGALAGKSSHIAEVLAASGTQSATVDLIRSGDIATVLRRWGEEMLEMCGVLDGTHRDSYLMEATQSFYWAALFAAMRSASWEALKFEEQRRMAAICGIGTVPELRAAITRLSGLKPNEARPEKLFLLWNVADRIYRVATPPDKQWSLEQLMEADLQEMKKRPYLEPILEMVPE